MAAIRDRDRGKRRAGEGVANAARPSFLHPHCLPGPRPGKFARGGPTPPVSQGGRLPGVCSVRLPPREEEREREAGSSKGHTAHLVPVQCRCTPALRRSPPGPAPLPHITCTRRELTYGLGVPMPKPRPTADSHRRPGTNLPRALTPDSESTLCSPVNRLTDAGKSVEQEGRALAKREMPQKRKCRGKWGEERGRSGGRGVMMGAGVVEFQGDCPPTRSRS